MDVIAAHDPEGRAGHLDPRALGLGKAAYSVRSSLYAALKRGELRRVKVGKRTLLCAHDLVSFLTRR